jgi:hypothetical protein
VGEPKNSNQPEQPRCPCGCHERRALIEESPLGLTERQRQQSDASERVLPILGDGPIADMLVGATVPLSPRTLHNVHNQRRVIE